MILGLPRWLSGKESACNAGNARDAGSIPGSGRSPEGGNSNPLQYSCMENPMGRGAWQAIVHRIAKSRTRLNTHALSSVQSFCRVQLFAIPWISAHQASLSITNSQSLPKLMSIESVMPSNHLILCHPLLLLPSIFPNIMVFSNESAVPIRWPKYWSFNLIISPSNEHPGLISFRMDSLQSKGLSRVFSNTTVQKHQFFSTQLSSQSNSHIHTWLLEKP